MQEAGLSLPAYLIPMLIAAIMRNVVDGTSNKTPINEISIVGNVCLSLFLSMALMSMKLWQLADLALPLITILLMSLTMLLSTLWEEIMMQQLWQQDIADSEWEQLQMQLQTWRHSHLLTDSQRKHFS